jgi:phage terminase large subunit GpA-like protein
MELIAETEITCPHCGEAFTLQIDTSQSGQSVIEDCTVCCWPITLTIRCHPGVIVDLRCSGAL